MTNNRLLTLIALSALLVALPACKDKAPRELDQPAPAKATVQAQKSPATLTGTEDVFTKVARDVTPAVVNIQAYQKVEDTGSPEYNQGMPKDRYHGFGGGGEKGKPHTEATMGSGVIFTSDGYILTNSHVVTDATEITVKLPDKREFTAKLVGDDTKTDIAVLKVDTKGVPLPKAVLGDSSKLEPGQWAIAIGNPFGLEHTVTVGVVSATGRGDVGVAQYENFIQTDASINPGNSGGPLLNSRGEVIGINTAIMSAGQGISFSIPINTAKEIAKALIEKGKVVRGWLGVGIQNITPELATGLGFPGRDGVLINKIFKASPALKAHIEPGDVIIMYDGRPVTESHQLQEMVAGTKVGRTVDIKLYRFGKERIIKAVIQELAASEKQIEADKTERESATALGITVRPMDVATSEGLGYQGVVVFDVEGGSAAEKAGVMPGDVIVSIGLSKVPGLKEFKKTASKFGKGNTAALLVIRGGSPTFIAFKAGQ